MYPRVKVKEEEIDRDQYEFEMKSLQSVKGFKFISLDDLSFLDDSPTSIVRIPRMSSSNSATPMVSSLKGEYRDKSQNDSENNKTNIKVPRPRAVLSSPDNDGLITNKIKQGEELLLSGSKNRVLSQNRHLQCGAAGVKPFQLLEINVISAQDLEPVSRKMNTYATAWMNPKRKLTSRVDKEGHVNPTWNDKFVFRVDDEFLREDTSAVQIEIHCVNWFRDNLVGSVRVLVGNLIPPIVNGRPNQLNFGMRFVALQVRRPSGRPQGILNIGVALLDSSMRSMPLYRQLSASAVGYLDLMANDDHKINNNDQPSSLKPILRRTLSERSEFMAFDKMSAVSSTVVGIPLKTTNYKDVEKDGSILSISFEPPPPVPKFDGNYKKKGKASSMINVAELVKKDKKGKNGKSGSVISDSIVSKDSSMYKALNENKKAKVSHDVKVEEKKDVANGKQVSKIDAHKVTDEKPLTISKLSPKDKTTNLAIGRPIPKYNFFEYGNGKYGYGAPYKGGSMCSDSEVGPSPSEVAAAIAERRYPLDEERSSVLDGWSCNESVEGLKSKLERWRTELPPIYDNGYASSSFPSTSHQTRRRNDGGGPSGMFTCFGNIFGYECQCVCGKPPEKKRQGARYQSSSIDSRSLF